MTVSLPRHAAREIFKLTSRPQYGRQCLRSFEIRTPCAQPSRPKRFQPSVRFSSTRAAPGTPHESRRLGALSVFAAGSGVLAFLYSAFGPIAHAQHFDARADDTEAFGADDELPRYRLSEVKKHGPKSARPWVTYEDKIYDITDWIPAHPGGEVILRAAGGSIEPYWDIFKIHKAPYVREILEQYVVGKVHPDDLKDGRPRMQDIEDPFEADPVRDERLHALTAKPCNAETAGGDLADSFLTPNEVFYVRNHMWTPSLADATGDSHGITIELPDGDTKTYTVGDLKKRFKQYAVTAVLQCSGNRRKHMTEQTKQTNGLQWGAGAISCAKWEGVRLRDVLADAGLSINELPEDAQHIQFSGLEAYGASVPIHSALDPRGDVLLAFKMNDQPLPRDHGFPVRVIVPGTVAARCVKWVNKIAISDEESNTTWQRRDYKCFGPNETKQDWDKYKSIQQMPVTSAITRTMLKPLPAGAGGEDSAQSSVLELQGYAYSGGGHEIQRVDVSLDDGKTWDQARIVDDSALRKGNKDWCWKRWVYEAPAPRPGQKMQLVVKATDDAYNTQPETHDGIYNLRGNLATAWHRVEFGESAASGGANADASAKK